MSRVLTTRAAEFNVNDLIRKLESKLNAFAGDDISSAKLIGIHSGGAWVAERLGEKLNISEPPGTLNISFYRDDFTNIGLHPRVKPSNLPFSVENKTIILIDDVLHTGRTARAALNEIFDYGRPARIIFASLIVRNGRELPIQPDVYALKIELGTKEHIKLKNSAGDLSLEIVGTAEASG